MTRFQRGCLRVEPRKAGDTWVLRFYITRESDGRRVEHKVPVGLVRDLKSESAAWAEVDRLHLHQQINQPTCRGRVTLGDIAAHYEQNELLKRAHTTQYLHKHIIRDYLNPRWGRNVAVGIESLEVEKWLAALDLANPTRAKIRAVMTRLYSHAQKHKLIPRDQASNPMNWVSLESEASNHDPVILTPQEAWALVSEFPLLERTLTILTAATGLRISECLGLQWQDIDYNGHRILVRRRWIDGDIDGPKTRASGRPVPLSEALAEVLQTWQCATLYSRPEDWVFASTRMRGQQPRRGSMMAQDYLRPAAIRLGVKIATDQRFGFHNLRHSLATFLVNRKTDVKTVQSLLRHSNVSTTLDVYAHAIDDSKLAAQRTMMEAMRNPGMVN